MIFIAATGKIMPGSIQFYHETISARFLLQVGLEHKLVHSVGLAQYRLLENICPCQEILVIGTEHPNGRRPALVSRVILPFDRINLTERQMILSAISQEFEAHL